METPLTDAVDIGLIYTIVNVNTGRFLRGQGEDAKE
jgi:hypothetical protein